MGIRERPRMTTHSSAFRAIPTLDWTRFDIVNEWRSEKQKLDNCPKDLWRVHDKLYDLSKFAGSHPGGKFFISETRGMDITEMFEAHHVDIEKAEVILKKYFVQKADGPRNSQYTFSKSGFYHKLRKRALPIWKTHKKNTFNSIFTLYSWFILSCGFIYLALTRESQLWLRLAAFFGALTVNVAHNFFHQADSLHMWLFDISLMNSQRWRVTHAMSHHIYPNTFFDLELTQFEPFVYFAVKKTSPFYPLISAVILPIFMAIVTYFDMIKRAIGITMSEAHANFGDFIPLLELIVMVYINKNVAIQYFFMYHLILGFFFALLSLPGIHHHSGNYHENDIPRKDKDWGLLQVDTIMDRSATSSRRTKSTSVPMSIFGDHTLHHLFPAVDASVLKHFYPAFLETMKEFKINYEETNIAWD